jgi:hypothetical protein
VSPRMSDPRLLDLRVRAMMVDLVNSAGKSLGACTSEVCLWSKRSPSVKLLIDKRPDTGKVSLSRRRQGRQTRKKRKQEKNNTATRREEEMKGTMHRQEVKGRRRVVQAVLMTVKLEERNPGVFLVFCCNHVRRLGTPPSSPRPPGGYRRPSGARPPMALPFHSSNSHGSTLSAT